MISGVCSLINGLITAGSWFVCANKSWWLGVNKMAIGETGFGC
jgi:hypothetical protein